MSDAQAAPAEAAQEAVAHQKAPSDFLKMVLGRFVRFSLTSVSFFFEI